MTTELQKRIEQDASGFVLLSDHVPGVVQEIRYFSTFNFVGDRIDGYEEPVAILTKEAARALKTVANQANVMGYRLKIFDAYRPEVESLRKAADVSCRTQYSCVLWDALCHYQ